MVGRPYVEGAQVTLFKSSFKSFLLYCDISVIRCMKLFILFYFCLFWSHCILFYFALSLYNSVYT